MTKEISMTEAIGILNVSRQSIYKYVKKGYLTMAKNEFTGRVHFDREEVKKLKEAIDRPPFSED